MSLRDDYQRVTPPDSFIILTVVRHADTPEYRRYEISTDELPEFIREMETPQHAEQIVSIERGETSY
ncbi:MAG: hypothetical protein J07HQW1_02749 [Haloquadratum walsbyi J07HQW1]|jgi:hypothetical protein|uniref:Uncharacterized protein n=1 Tax=Haloquadratum walsbyi J07HQW1 TaxID=1238424 RepID=U1N865_9EURY|nr:MAG: hypothetical protein J07HQW1_02749 [Haloquadratum walsbyi J07HQW1]